MPFINLLKPRNFLKNRQILFYVHVSVSFCLLFSPTLHACFVYKSNNLLYKLVRWDTSTKRLMFQALFLIFIDLEHSKLNVGLQSKTIRKLLDLQKKNCFIPIPWQITSLVRSYLDAKK